LDIQALQVHKDLRVHKVHKVQLEQPALQVQRVRKVLLDQLVRKA
jgi:hypothetical protein